MFIRGSGSGEEYKRIDNAFYRGIVVKNSDPIGLNRIKIFVPELSNQPFDSWLGEYLNFNISSIGENTKTDWSEKENNIDWSDIKIYEEIAKLLPWAEPCTPLVGEIGNFRYYKDGKICTISDCNYPEGFEINNTESPTLSAGSFSPAFLYENYETRLGDAFSSPHSNYCIKGNAYSYANAPTKYSNKSKGLFGVPEVGSKVWVFHYMGDYNYPIYFGSVGKSYRELSLINDYTENVISSKINNTFEN
jgi:hypothetical protein